MWINWSHKKRGERESDGGNHLTARRALNSLRNAVEHALNPKVRFSNEMEKELI